MSYVTVITETDVVVQIARCSFDAHILHILGSLLLGATVLMVHPGGILEFQYFSRVLKEKQVTLMDAVPSLSTAIFTYLEENGSLDSVKYLRSLISAGMLHTFSRLIVLAPC